MVTFDGNGGASETRKKEYEIGEAYGSLPAATRTGYAFLGWWTAKSGGKKVTAGDTVTTASSRTVYAHWTKTQTVKFEGNGGTCKTRSKGYTIGKAYGSFPEATRAGYGFAGWAADAGGGTPVAKTDKATTEASRTLYAQWTTDQTVTFDANGGTCEIATKVYRIGGTYGEFPEATKAGRGFLGWYTAKTDGKKVSAGATVVSEKASRTLYAHWTTTQTVAFDGNGGTCKTKSKGYTIGKAYGSFPEATRAGYGFAGWAADAGGGTSVEKTDKATSEASRTLYAQWTTEQTVTFDATGGTCGMAKKVYRIGGTYGELPEAAKAGRGFLGWYTAKTDGKKVSAGMTVVNEKASRALYANWTTTQTVAFDGNGGTCKTKSKGYTIGKAYGSFPTATRAGYGFAGWAAEAGGAVPVGKGDKATETAKRTLYAQWTTEQTVTFDANGGACGTAAMVYRIGGTYGELPEAAKAGRGFLGWYTAKSDGKKVKPGETAVTEAASRTLYVHWTTKQTVTFNANGGKCKTATKEYTIGKAYGSLPTATRAGGFRFAGWGTAPEGGTAVGKADKATEEAKRTLYAQWGSDKQRVRFEANGGRCGTAEGEWTVGGKYSGLPEAERPGYEFQGWWTAAEGGARVAAEAGVTGEERRTLYAQWRLADREYAAWVRGLGRSEGEFEPKGDADGDGTTNWEEYVAETDPLDEKDLLEAKIQWEEGRPVVDAPAVDGKRRGFVEGKKELTDEEWTDVTGVEDLEGAGWRFFRVGVGMGE